MSQQAVSKVVGNGRGSSGIRVSPMTRRRILRVARRLNYRPHRQAQLLRGVKSGVIGVIKPTGMNQTMVERSFFAAQAIHSAGYSLLVNEIHWEELGERRAVTTMLDARVEGVLLDGLGSPSDPVLTEFRRLRDAKIPMVALGSVRQPSIPSVTTDYRQGMAELTKHLLWLGRRNLALVLTIPEEDLHLPRYWGFAERLAGFREVFAEAGLDPAHARVLHQPTSAGWLDGHAPGHAAIRSLIESGERPEVILFSNDDMAIGALAACADAGWKVPEDLAVTGFDDTTLGRYARPTLTTVAQPTKAVAQRAVRMLLEQIRGEKLLAGDELVKLPCQLVVRQSCGAKAAQAWNSVEKADELAGDACPAIASEGPWTEAP